MGQRDHTHTHTQSFKCSNDTSNQEQLEENVIKSRNRKGRQDDDVKIWSGRISGGGDEGRNGLMTRRRDSEEKKASMRGLRHLQRTDGCVSFNEFGSEIKSFQAHSEA